MTNSLPLPIAIGDLQGCLDPLKRLLDLVPANAPLWFCGDLVNRGPQSLETLRFVKSLGERAVTVLGNHDLHVLAVAYGIRPAHADDTLDVILDAPDRDELINWLRHRPLAHYAHGHLLVHAGVLPQWTLEQTLSLAAEVEGGLRGDHVREFLATMYGNEPARWDDALVGADRHRVVINALTRLRFCDANGTMDFKTKEGVGSAPVGFMPWFDVPGRRTRGTPIVCGHWSTLGLVLRPDLLALDTGCVWGGCLTGVALGPDRRQWQVRCPQAAVVKHR
ncbi:MAG TPA: symmetrical bis(5'-nucleosyl)-tetraphosphatase [Burkholderiaceae bacterium]|nr:symmetrical bis(5'-nucleosyl)-tetraphosphatase [Burkholderiaceae bacterium]